jgi:hypothetical protein
MVLPLAAVALKFPKPSGTPRKPSYDPLGSCGRAYHCRTTRAASSSRPPKHLSSIEIRELLPATKCQRILIFAGPVLRPHFPPCLDLWVYAQSQSS